MNPAITSASAQGSRTDQQDRYVTTRIPEDPEKPLRGWLLAIFDGHGGAQVAELSVRELVSEFDKAWLDHGGQADRSLRATVHALSEKTLEERSGSTVAMAYIPATADEVYWAVLGDSIVALTDRLGDLQISPIHNARIHMDERRSAVGRGAVYVDGYLEDSRRPGYGLQASRGLGDKDLARILNRDPDVRRFALGPQSIVLLVSDGIFDVMDHTVENQIKRIVTLAQQGHDAQALVEDALSRETGDNVTVLIWRSVGR
jgi:serine/threonine protein phosphatase PrpC